MVVAVDGAVIAHFKLPFSGVYGLADAIEILLDLL